MATGWAGDGAVQDQIDATVKDGIERARKQLPQGPGLTHCEECDSPIPEARRKAVPDASARTDGPGRLVPAPDPPPRRDRRSFVPLALLAR